MALSFIDARPAAHQGNLPLATLEAIMTNSIYTPPFNGWSRANATIRITNGAHHGAFYPNYGDYYFDITVDADPTVLHCLISNPANANNHVLSVQ